MIRIVFADFLVICATFGCKPDSYVKRGKKESVKKYPLTQQAQRLPVVFR